MKPTIATITTTVGSREQAIDLARHLVEAKLAACVQIDGPIQSLYRWIGDICNESEFRLTCKSLLRLAQAIIELVKEKHPYELPEILIASVDCSEEYARWLQSQVD